MSQRARTETNVESASTEPVTRGESRVDQLVLREARRNERRINRVKLALVSLGIVMTFTFRLHAGEAVALAVGWQVGVMFVWVAAMLVVEGLTKELGVDILVSSKVAQRLPRSFTFEPLGGRHVRGRAEPLVVYWLAGGPDDLVLRRSVTGTSGTPPRSSS